ncbi:MAG: NAD(P)-dependent oxidoreductase [Actinomycetota bacterium]
MTRLRVIVDPTFRRMDEIFSIDARARLDELVEVIWGSDEVMPAEEFLAAAHDADVIVFGGWRHGRAGLDAAANAQALLEVAGGHEHDLDYTEALRRGMLVGSCAPAFTDVVAEHTLGLTIAAARGINAADRAMRSGDERWLHDGNRYNTTLLGATVGFVGCGGIAQSLRRMLEPFGVRPLGYDPPLGDARVRAAGFEPNALDELFTESHVVFVLAAPTTANRHIVSADLLDRLAPSDVLVVTSRSHLVDFEALADRLKRGNLKAAIDVFPSEPLPANDPLRDAAPAVLTPHLAGALPDALLRIGDLVVRDLEAICRGERPTGMQYLDATNRDGLLQH